MIELYKNIKRLREEKGMSQDTLAKLTGYTDRSSIAKIEKGLVDLQQSKISLFATALGTTSRELMGWDDSGTAVPTPATQEETTLSPKDERDIAKKLEETINQLDSHDDLMFDGGALDDETKELLRASLENSLRIGKINAKKKYTPKKYRKSEN